MKISFKSAFISAFLVFFLYGCSVIDFQPQEGGLTDDGDIFTVGELEEIEDINLQDEEGIEPEEIVNLVVSESEEEPKDSFSLLSLGFLKKYLDLKKKTHMLKMKDSLI